VESYFSILEETLLARLLPSYGPGIKVCEATHHIQVKGRHGHEAPYSGARNCGRIG
jgi:hypothetical protein